MILGIAAAGAVVAVSLAVGTTAVATQGEQIEKGVESAGGVISGFSKDVAKKQAQTQSFIRNFYNDVAEDRRKAQKARQDHRGAVFDNIEKKSAAVGKSVKEALHKRFSKSKGKGRRHSLFHRK